MTGITAVPLTTAAASDNLSQPLLLMAHPRQSQDSRGDRNDAETQEQHHLSQQKPKLCLEDHVDLADGGHGHDRS